MPSDKILKRIQNLLDMANDASSPEEAMIAGRRARFLMDKHQIEEHDLKKNKKAFEFGKAYGKTSTKKPPLYISTIGFAIAKLNDCQIYGAGPFQVVFQGIESDAKIAALLFEYVTSILETRVKYLPPKGASFKRNFRFGFAHGIEAQVENILAERDRKSITSDGTSLMVVKSQIVEQHFGVQRTGGTKQRGGKVDFDGYHAGLEAGQNTPLHDKVES